MILYTIFGLVPLFYTENFYFLLACRLGYAVGFGLITFYNPAFVYVFGPERGSKYVAQVASVASIGTLVFQNTAAPLLNISLNATYVVYGIGLVILIIFRIFYKEPELNKDANTVEVDKTEQKKKMGGAVYAYLIGYFVIFLLSFPAMLSTSTLLAAKGIESVSVAGIALSFFTAGGIVAGVVYDKINSVLKKFTLPLVMLMFAAGYAVLIFSSSVAVLFAANFIIGMAFMFVGPLVFLYGGSVMPKENIALFGSLVTAAACGAQFLSTPYISFVGKLFGNGDVIITPFVVGMICFIVLGVATLFVDVRPKGLR